MTSIAKLQIYYALQFFLSINKAIHSKQEFIFHRIYLSGSTEFLDSKPINSHIGLIPSKSVLKTTAQQLTQELVARNQHQLQPSCLCTHPH